MLSTRSCDASERTPPQDLSRRLSGLLRPCDASQRTPPQNVIQCVVGDASQRTPTSRPCPHVAGSWNVAAAAVAATHAAAVTRAAPMPPVPAGAGACPVSTSDASALAQAPCSVESLKCWLAGISDNSGTSADDLAQRLRAALPESYED